MNYTQKLNGESIFKARLFIKDGSFLAVYERFEALSLKYGYQWMHDDNSLIICWDNADHHPEIRTHPHHKHVGGRGNVHPSEETTPPQSIGFYRQSAGDCLRKSSLQAKPSFLPLKPFLYCLFYTFFAFPKSLQNRQQPQNKNGPDRRVACNAATI